MSSNEITVLKESGKELMNSKKTCQKSSRKRLEEKNGEILRVTKLHDDKSSHRFGEKYPGIVIGHQSCEGSGGLIPKYMGWLWNVEYLGVNNIRKGTASEPVEEILKNFLNPDLVGRKKTARERQVEEQESLSIQSQNRSLQRDEFGKFDPMKTNEMNMKPIKIRKVSSSQNAQTQYDISDFSKIVSSDSKAKETKLDRKSSTKNQSLVNKISKQNSIKTGGKAIQPAENKTNKSVGGTSAKRYEDSVKTKKALKPIIDKQRKSLQSAPVKTVKPAPEKNVKTIKEKFEKKSTNLTTTKPQKEVITSVEKNDKTKKSLHKTVRNLNVVESKTVKTDSKNSLKTHKTNQTKTQVLPSKVAKISLQSPQIIRQTIPNPKPRKISCDLNETSSVEKSRNSTYHCATSNYKSCQQNSSHVDVGHWNSLKAQEVCNQMMIQQNCPKLCKSCHLH